MSDLPKESCPKHLFKFQYFKGETYAKNIILGVGGSSFANSNLVEGVYTLITFPY